MKVENDEYILTAVCIAPQGLGYDFSSLTFTIPETAQVGTVYNIDIFEAMLYDFYGNPIENFVLEDGSITIVEATTDPTEPSTDPTEPSTEPTEPDILRGDISGNGKIDLYDAIEICKYIMNMRTFTDEEYQIADFDANTVVDLYDAIGIAKELLPK